MRVRRIKAQVSKHIPEQWPADVACEAPSVAPVADYYICRNRSRFTDSPRPRSSLPTPSYHSPDEGPRLTPANHEYPGNQLATRTRPRSSISSVPAELSTRLFQNYFNYIHPLWPILYKPMYASLDYGNPTQMMPVALVAAVFAIASCIDKPQQMAPNSIVQKYNDPDTFYEKAAELLQYDETKDDWHAANSTLR